MIEMCPLNFDQINL